MRTPMLLCTASFKSRNSAVPPRIWKRGGGERKLNWIFQPCQLFVTAVSWTLVPSPHAGRDTVNVQQEQGTSQGLQLQGGHSWAQPNLSRGAGRGEETNSFPPGISFTWQGKVKMGLASGCSWAGSARAQLEGFEGWRQKVKEKTKSLCLQRDKVRQATNAFE